jgi:capsular polysaccharide export protein
MREVLAGAGTSPNAAEAASSLDKPAEERRDHPGHGPEIVACLGMSWWKQGRIAEFLRAGDRTPKFFRTVSAAVRHARNHAGAIAVWASREPVSLAAAAAAAGVPVLRIEDGFLRSVGLGADFTPAASIVVDRLGIYYDPSHESDLEHLLNHAEFDAELLQRARRLIDLLIASRVTKYNTGAALAPIRAAAGQRVILVPGQVEDDRSVALGGTSVKTNRTLLEQVRARHPDAYILYKPHPDVDAGHRTGALPDRLALRFADQIVRGVSVVALLDACTEVHTITSLAGFEALLRGRRVVAYGRPFYSGWGLTEDLAEPLRSRRALTVEALAAATLILYPRYLDPLSRRPCTPEALIERLRMPELWRAGPWTRLRRLHGVLMRGWRARAATAQAGAP